MNILVNKKIQNKLDQKKNKILINKTLSTLKKLEGFESFNSILSSMPVHKIVSPQYNFYKVKIDRENSLLMSYEEANKNIIVVDLVTHDDLIKL